ADLHDHVDALAEGEYGVLNPEIITNWRADRRLHPAFPPASGLCAETFAQFSHGDKQTSPDSKLGKISLLASISALTTSANTGKKRTRFRSLWTFQGGLPT
ncbi:MAG: hypothetical protein ACM3S1_08415, partial [Hyphomicrobiales bacterium]